MPGKPTFGMRSWADVVAFGTLVSMLIACVLWGLKLESELNVVRDRQFQLQQQVQRGILPRAEERIHDLERRADDFEEHIKSRQQH